LAFGRPCRVIAERVHADEEDIQKYEFKKWGHRGDNGSPLISAASYGGDRGTGADGSSA
jgi:hypothetical protein